MLNPAFHFVKLQSLIPIMVDQTRKTINELLLLSNERQFIDLQTEINTLTLAIIASSAFGKDFESMTNSKRIINRVVTELLEATEYRMVRMIDQIPIILRLPFWRKDIINKKSKEISDFVDQIIADRRHNRSTSLSSHEDILDILLSAVDTQGQTFDDQEIKDQALTFVLADHETTDNLMTWTMYILMTNEQVLKACRDEVDRILPNSIEPTYEHLNELIVCEAVLQETLRLYSPVPFLARKCVREHLLGSEGHHQIHLPVGAEVGINTYILHRREEFWPRPLEFDYTRWIRDPVTGLKPKLAHAFCYLSFGAGSRNCIGQHFALLEAKVLLAMFLQ
ncbi:unnamed protein product [Rotaria sordida]|uniref:Cytochrome P450 n=1 Tax=Rotaria sordida TaxID=392033 RepID=A0A814DDM2_9BILA|nr:unnamed protein product [Rotaria sordida]CAF1298502.1 unnamed protein product [Rotaria sordida]